MTTIDMWEYNCPIQGLTKEREEDINHISTIVTTIMMKRKLTWSPCGFGPGKPIWNRFHYSTWQSKSDTKSRVSCIYDLRECRSSSSCGWNYKDVRQGTIPCNWDAQIPPFPVRDRCRCLRQFTNHHHNNHIFWGEVVTAVLGVGSNRSLEGDDEDQQNDGLNDWWQRKRNRKFQAFSAPRRKRSTRSEIHTEATFCVSN